jgi:nicotinamidase/pyrazinamidase
MKTKTEEPFVIKRGAALVVVDVQNDFLPGGALAVPEGDRIILPLNDVITKFQDENLPIFFTRDWHPLNHSSFLENGGTWPVHCVKDTKGAAFASELEVPDGAVIISKASGPDTDEYSGLKGFGSDGSRLDEILKRENIRRVVIGGLATDYCVLNTVLDALDLGCEVHVLTDAVRAVNVKPDDGTRAIQDMTDKGARFLTSESIG